MNAVADRVQCLRALPRNIIRTLGLFARHAGRWYARGLSLLETGLLHYQAQLGRRAYKVKRAA